MLVGGRGSRLAPLTDGTPKPLLPVAGRPFLYWPMLALRRAGIRKFVLAAGHRASDVERFATKQRNSGMDVSVKTESSPLGTGGALAAVIGSLQIDEQVIVANGDSLVSNGLETVIAGADAQSDGVIALVRVRDGSRFGSVVADAAGMVTHLNEKAAGSGLVNAGLYCFRRELMSQLPVHRPLSLEREVIPHWLKQGARLRAALIDGPFIDIGTPSSLAAADAFIRDRFNDQR
jgi:NDP-sugar pyrophosphorylase family protein